MNEETDPDGEWILDALRDAEADIAEKIYQPLRSGTRLWVRFGSDYHDVSVVDASMSPNPDAFRDGDWLVVLPTWNDLPTEDPDTGEDLTEEEIREYVVEPRVRDMLDRMPAAEAEDRTRVFGPIAEADA